MQIVLLIGMAVFVFTTIFTIYVTVSDSDTTEKQ